MAFKRYHEEQVSWQRTKERNYESNYNSHTCYNCLYCRKYKGRYYCSNSDNTLTSAYSKCCSEFCASPYSSPIEDYD